MLSVEEIPRPGETVLGLSQAVHLGGKGANQATAASASGATTSIVGCIGNDPHREGARRALQASAVKTENLFALPEVPTGSAAVLVDSHGENSKVVLQGGNALLSEQHIASAERTLRRAAVTLGSLEVPLQTVVTAMQLSQGVRVLNPAPWQPLSDDLLQSIDVLTPNQTELASLCDRTARCRPTLMRQSISPRSFSRPNNTATL